MIESAFVQSVSAIALLGYGAFHLMYFSPKALRRLAAWAMARADSIEFELAKRRKYLIRLKEDVKPPKMSDQERKDAQWQDMYKGTAWEIGNDNPR